MAFKYIYGTTRTREYGSSMNLGDISLNGRYTTAFFNKGQFLDYEEAGITKLSMPINNSRYIGTVPKIDANETIIGTVPKLTRFIMMKYSDIYTNATDLSTSIEKSGADTNVQMFTDTITAIQWIKDNTDLLLVSEVLDANSVAIEAIFELKAEYTDTDGNIVVQELLEIK